MVSHSVSVRAYRMIEVSLRSLNHMDSPHIKRTYARPILRNERTFLTSTPKSQFDPEPPYVNFGQRPLRALS